MPLAMFLQKTLILIVAAYTLSLACFSKLQASQLDSMGQGPSPNLLNPHLLASSEDLVLCTAAARKTPGLIVATTNLRWRDLWSRVRAAPVNWRTIIVGASGGLLVCGGLGTFLDFIVTFAEEWELSDNQQSFGAAAQEGLLIGGGIGLPLGAISGGIYELYPTLKEAFAEKKIVIRHPCSPLQPLAVDAEASCPVCCLQFLGGNLEEEGEAPAPALTIVRPPCEHLLCCGCYEKILSMNTPKKCPLCRRAIPVEGEEVDLLAPRLKEDLEAPN